MSQDNQKPNTGSGSQTGAQQPAKEPDPKPEFPSNETVRHYVIIPRKPGGSESQDNEG